VNLELNTGSGLAIWLNLGLNKPERVQEVQFMFNPGSNAELVLK
jgi:hypothetical protein